MSLNGAHRGANRLQQRNLTRQIICSLRDLVLRFRGDHVRRRVSRAAAASRYMFYPVVVRAARGSQGRGVGVDLGMSWRAARIIHWPPGNTLGPCVKLGVYFRTPRPDSRVGGLFVLPPSAYPPTSRG